MLQKKKEEEAKKATDDDDDDDDDDDESGPPSDYSNQQSSDGTEPLFYPEVMTHRCLTHKVNFISDDGSDPSVSLEQLHRIRIGWSCKGLRIDTKAKTMMEGIIKHCGLEPLFATPKDMDDQDILLGCPLCAQWPNYTSDNAKVSVFGWKAALKHQSVQHYRQSVAWIKLSEDQADTARRTEDVQPLRSDEWSCTHCLDRPSEQKFTTLAIIKQHLLSKHEVSEPQLNADYHGVNAAETSNRGYLRSAVNIVMKQPENKWNLAEADYDDWIFGMGFYDDEDDFMDPWGEDF